MPMRPATHSAKQAKTKTFYKTPYNYRWQKLRLSFLKDNPLCVVCLADGRVTPANEVDHIRPHRGDKLLFWNVNNLQSLCKSCHSCKTATEDRVGGS
jgi:5-methylcytosine-specific restriction protein A